MSGSSTTVSQLVLAVSIETKEPAETIYGRIFSRLHTLYGFDVYRCPRGQNEPLLSVASRYGWEGELYALAYAEHLYQLQYEQ